MIIVGLKVVKSRQKSRSQYIVMMNHHSSRTICN
jgi:hypothetical protein